MQNTLLKLATICMFKECVHTQYVIHFYNGSAQWKGSYNGRFTVGVRACTRKYALEECKGIGERKWCANGFEVVDSCRLMYRPSVRSPQCLPLVVSTNTLYVQVANAGVRKPGYETNIYMYIRCSWRNFAKPYKTNCRSSIRTYFHSPKAFNCTIIPCCSSNLELPGAILNSWSHDWCITLMPFICI